MFANNQLITNYTLYPGVGNPYIHPYLWWQLKLQLWSEFQASNRVANSKENFPESAKENNCAEMRTKCSLHFIRLLTHSEFGAKGKILDHSWSPIFSDGWKSAERYFGWWSLFMCKWEIILFLYQPNKQVSKIIYCSMESCWQKLKNLIKWLYKQASRNNLPLFKSKTLHS